MPDSAAFTIVVLSAFISTPVCVVHSCKVFEYIKLSTAKSLTISPSTGFSKFNFTFVFFVFSSGLLLV